MDYENFIHFIFHIKLLINIIQLLQTLSLKYFPK